MRLSGGYDDGKLSAGVYLQGEHITLPRNAVSKQKPP